MSAAPHPPVADAATQRTEQRRKQAIKKVKAMARELALEDATYRALLHTTTGCHSAAHCTLAQLGAVIEQLKRGGATDTNPLHADGRKRLQPSADRAPLMAKVIALLQALGAAQGKPAYPLSYADAICAKNHWCTRVDFATPQILHQLVGALSRTLQYQQRKKPSK